MQGVVPDERRRALLARIAAVVSVVSGTQVGVEPFLESGVGDGDSDPTTDSGGAEETAVVDRLEDGTAVVLFEDAGYQRTVRADVLPRAAREEGAVLRVPEGEALALATVDRTATEQRRVTARERVDDLAERPDDS